MFYCRDDDSNVIEMAEFQDTGTVVIESDGDDDDDDHEIRQPVTPKRKFQHSTITNGTNNDYDDDIMFTPVSKSNPYIITPKTYSLSNNTPTNNANKPVKLLIVTPIKSPGGKAASNVTTHQSRPSSFVTPIKRPIDYQQCMQNDNVEITAPIVHKSNDTVTFESTTTSGKKIFITKFLNCAEARNYRFPKATMNIIQPTLPSTTSATSVIASTSRSTSVIASTSRSIKASPTASKPVIVSAASVSTKPAKEFKSFADVLQTDFVPGSNDEIAAIKFCEQFIKNQTESIANFKRIINATNTKIFVTRSKMKLIEQDLKKLE